MFDRLETIELRFDELTAEMAQPEVLASHEKMQVLAKERAAIESVVTLYRSWRDTSKALEEVRAMQGDSDAAMAAMAREEVDRLATRHAELEEAVKRALRPKDPRDDRDVIFEIRAGAGGDEAALLDRKSVV